MDELQLEALGTHWTVVLDGDVFDDHLRQQLIDQIHDFDNLYSRFKPESPLSQLNALDSSKPIPITAELETMLQFGLQLSAVTDGLFDANVASWEKAYGYDETYQFKGRDDVPLATKGSFTIKDHHLIKNGLVQLDLGAFGKGYLIDLLAKILKAAGKAHFLVDGGRDFYGTSKADGKPWKLALEHPFDDTLAVGTLSLKNQGFAASNSFHRRVGSFHHLLDGQTGRPTKNMASVFVTAETAMMADGLSTAIFVSPPELWPRLTQKFDFEYLAVSEDLKTSHSANFTGEIFLK